MLFSALPTNLGNRENRFPHSHRHDYDEKHVRKSPQRSLLKLPASNPPFRLISGLEKTAPAHVVDCLQDDQPEIAQHKVTQRQLLHGCLEAETITTCTFRLCESDAARRLSIALVHELGGRYGWVPEEFSPDLVETEAWLEKHRGKSVTVLEILHGVLSWAWSFALLDFAGHISPS